MRDKNTDPNLFLASLFGNKLVFTINMWQVLSKQKERGFSKQVLECRKKFLYYFKKGFTDPTYKAWERDYKWQAHLAWEAALNKAEYQKLLASKQYNEIALRAVKLETKTNLLFSFEKMALRDAIKTSEGARDFSLGLYDYVYGAGPLQKRFENFAAVLASLPRKQTRVLTWPLQTVFGFIAKPEEHIFIKPRVTKIAAEKYGYDLQYKSKPNWDTYKSMIGFAEKVRDDMKGLHPKDYIDLQSFIWVMGSDEYPD
jgi:hypothetical protein